MPKTGLTPEQIKDRAIECTIARMRKFGHEKVRLSDIAKDLGVSHAALYSHFADKAALFDAVSERWLRGLDGELDAVCANEQKLDSLALLTEWFLTLHRAKCTKVRNDPELYRAFNFSALIEKPFVRMHMQNMDRQLNTLLKEAVERKLLRGEPKQLIPIFFEATMSFHHPILVSQYINEEREDILRNILNVLFDGLK
ncbi:TetR family transcriptional regulator [soil metagenome]